MTKDKDVFTKTPKQHGEDAFNSFTYFKPLEDLLFVKSYIRNKKYGDKEKMEFIQQWINGYYSASRVYYDKMKKDKGAKKSDSGFVPVDKKNPKGMW